MSQIDIGACLAEMKTIYQTDPQRAIRGQVFIKLLHSHIASVLRARLSTKAASQNVKVVEEAQLFGSHKPKDVDVSVVHPINGPLMIIGLRSQMSSVGNNALTYYQDIIGECISLQDRFPLSTIGYIYLMPLQPIRVGHEHVVIDHRRYAKMYAAITGRDGHNFHNIKGVYDQFAYMIVDFAAEPPGLRDDIVRESVPHKDLSVSTFVDRMINTYKSRDLFLDFFD